MNLKESLKITGASFRYHPGVPLMKRDREKILGEYKRAVDKYLPLIEQRTGIDLGDIEVKWLGHAVRDGFRYNFNKSRKLLKTKAEVNLLRIVRGIAYPIVELLRMSLEDRLAAAYANFDKSIIAVPFGLATKMQLARSRLYGPNQGVDENVLHELTHHLWNKIAGGEESKDVLNKDVLKFWSEGYAMYGEHDWFSDFLPSGKNSAKMSSYSIGHVLGRYVIRDMVEIRGQDILFDIPKKWKEFGGAFITIDGLIPELESLIEQS